ncbi:MAG: adenine deaminase [Dehalococcoidia bacterium]|nr:adenine deaminase [Dehalococcoidia bacterium]
MVRKDELIRVARGQAPADLALRNARVVNTLTGSVEPGDVLVLGDRIAAVGCGSAARQSVDLDGAYLLPGLIDGHTHIESSMLHPARYAEAVAPHGTLTVVTDLHEIANVCGVEGIEFCMRWSRKLPLDMKFMAPSCVPATPLETSGATIAADVIRELLTRPDVIGLGEVMNYPGVLAGSKDVLEKLEAARGRPIDGHAPGLRGRDLSAYAAAGIMTDHECTSLDEASEKLAMGMRIMIREGSSEKNLEALLPLAAGETYRRCMFVVDDRSAADLSLEGDIDHVLRRAIALGLDPVRAVQLATINPAEYFRLHDRGAVAPGMLADLITVGDLATFVVDRVYHGGELVAVGGESLFAFAETEPELTDTVKMAPLDRRDLRIARNGSEFPVIGLIPGQIVTRKRMLSPGVSGDEFVSDTSRDILKLVVVERHHATGRVGKGFVTGFGLRRGALAGSIAHDSHNLVCVGVSDDDILGALRALERMQGGLVVFADGAVQAALPLPVAGLLSPEPVQAVIAAQHSVEEAARLLGAQPPAPFALLSFLALPVIPELRVTDLGVVDVGAFRVIA